MLAAVQYMLSKLVSPLWRRAEEGDEEDMFSSKSGTEVIRRLQSSVVTKLCLDHGLIDDVVYFTADQVLGGMLVKEGDLVNCIAVRDGPEGGWKAVRVEKSSNAWEDGGGAALDDESMQLRPLIGTVTSFDGEGGFINQNTFFPGSSLWQGYKPMAGDWVQAQYFITPTQWNTQAQSVAPLRYCRLDQARVTSVFGNSGAVEDKVFFSLDSLLLPDKYQPQPGHLVNLVMVESSQSIYSWRALCMAPCAQSIGPCPAFLPEIDLQALLANKGGLHVTEYGDFGDLMIRERRELVLWILNHGSETHRLKRCDFGGWDSEKQFSFVSVKGPPAPRQRQHAQGNSSESGSAPESDKKQPCDVKEADKEKVQRQTADTQEAELAIPPGERLAVTIACRAKSLGRCTELLLLHFSSFAIGRRLEVMVGSEEENLLQPTVPYCPSNGNSRPLPAATGQVITVSAQKDPPRLSNRRLPNFIPNYPVPQALRDCVEAHNDVLVVQPSLGETLSPSNMQSRFSALLWLEELHAERELGEFAICGALLRKGANHLHLEVIGLAEGRPVVNLGDKITLKKPHNDGVMMKYIAYVAEINEEDVSLRVNSDFQQSYLGEPLNVEFSYNRTTTKRCHHALHQTSRFGDILFPTSVIPQTPLWTGKWIEESNQSTAKKNNTALENAEVSSISMDMKSKATQTLCTEARLLSKPLPSKGHFFNPDLNPPQREAVKGIVEGVCRPIPYVLFGPPGTGKTVTLIEAILQIYHFVPSSRILVCTPSNSAADLICVRLHESGFLHTGSLARVNATFRQDKSIPEVLRPYSRAGEDIRQASFQRIVVSTCSSAGMFHNVGIHKGHFTHMFMDEAGQATEPETLIPMSLISDRDGQIVLAGDPHQLGPVVKSKLAATFGLGVSLLERLMSNPLYCRHDWGYNPKLVTKLIYNYRSHEALLVLPSKLFYQGELCFKASRDVVESLCQWKTLPKKNFPLLFHGVRGTEMKEGNNPSCFNPVEAVQVMLYCCQLTKRLYKPVDASDIGIIAPYKKQCEKIRVLLGNTGLSDIKVGSVEEFQGQEFLVIILSTVRSKESIPSKDLQSVLGFLTNPKRFNVAVTRPKALLIIVGNPHVLIMDVCFRALLQYCFINGAYLGCDPPPALRDSQIAAETERTE